MFLFASRREVEGFQGDFLFIHQVAISFYRWILHSGWETWFVRVGHIANLDVTHMQELGGKPIFH